MSTKEEKKTTPTKEEKKIKKRKPSNKEENKKKKSKKSKIDAKEEKAKKRAQAKNKKEINDSKFCLEVMKNLEQGISFGGWSSGVNHAVHRPSNVVNVLKRFQEFLVEEKLLEIFYVGIDEKEVIDMENKRMIEILASPEEQKRLSRTLRKVLAEVSYKGINRITLANKHAFSPLFASFNQIRAGGDKLLKGSKAVSVVYYAPRAERKKPAIPIAPVVGGNAPEEKLVLSRSNVFGMDQVSGGPLSAQLKQLQALWSLLMPAFAPLEVAEKLMARILAKYGKNEVKTEEKTETKNRLKLEHDATGCGYYQCNVIHLAPRSNYPPEEYYTTFFHELGHYMDMSIVPQEGIYGGMLPPNPPATSSSSSLLIANHKKSRDASPVVWSNPLCTKNLWSVGYRQKWTLFEESKEPNEQDDAKKRVVVEWVTNQHEDEKGYVTEQMENFVRLSLSYPCTKAMSDEDSTLVQHVDVLKRRLTSIPQLTQWLSAIDRAQARDNEIRSSSATYGWGKSRMCRIEFVIASWADPDFDGECESRCLFDSAQPFNTDVTAFLVDILSSSSSSSSTSSSLSSSSTSSSSSSSSTSSTSTSDTENAGGYGAGTAPSCRSDRTSKELVAELVAGLLSAEVGINTMQMSSDYCTSWYKTLKKMDNPHKLLNDAIRRAVKIANLIIADIS